MDEHIFISDSNLGAHVQFSGTIYESLYYGIQKGCYSIQIFLGNPISLKRCVINEKDIINTKKLLKRFPTNIFTHFPFIANLSGTSKGSLAWESDEKINNIILNCLNSIEYELDIMSKIGCGVVIHPGSFPDRKKGLLAISKSINKINFKNNYKLILENADGQGNNLGTTFEELKYIYDNIDENKKEYIGFCIDTCHIFAYGQYDISKLDNMKRMFNEFENIFGLKKLSLIHLNDSICNLGSKKDRHECLKNGLIWKENCESLLYLIDFCKSNNIPIILETHVNDILKI